MKFFLLIVLISSHSLFAQRPVDTTIIFQINGIRQYVRIKGKDVSKPLILFLHGGPGGSLMQKFDKISSKLQQHFVVVQWDQRETGETLKLNKTTGPLTLQLFYNDTHDLVDSLLRQFRKPKLYLIGYSWGSGLGFYIADKYPELLYAYIAVSPVIAQHRSDSISLVMLKEKMGKKARQELAQVQIPFQNAEQLYYHRKWLYKYDGQKLVSLTLKKSFVQSWAATWFDVWSRSTDVDLFQTLPVIKCPIYFFAGAKDYNTNSSITTEYYSKVSAPKKDLFLFNNAGHGLPETNYDGFQDMIIRKILPQTSDQ
ncbi:MAG TPA: alpha/beta hydrolase [Chitinophagaceae bacterium]|nr:alpha/beta hydrolase [Chitinophagaceae bacterium]